MDKLKDNIANKINDALPVIDSLWNYSNPQDTQLKFFKIQELATKQGNKPYIAELKTQIARTYSLQRQFEEAHQILDTLSDEFNFENENEAKSKNYYGLTEDKFQIIKIRYLLEKGRTLNSSGSPQVALPLFYTAYKLSEEIKQDYYSVDALHMLGIADTPEKQLEWNLLAMKIAEGSTNRRAKNWLGALYNNNGWSYHSLQKFDSALDMFNKSLAWRTDPTRADKTDVYEVIIAKWCIARVYRDLEKIDEAINILNELLIEIDLKKLPEDGFVYEELGECYLIKKETELMKGYFGKAYLLLSKIDWLSKERLERIRLLGEIF